MKRLVHVSRAAGALVLLMFAGLSAPALRAQASPRVVILGFDGADAKLTRQWMDEGKLPNLAKLRDQGTFSPLRSTIPSQTPVSWSTFSTGLNPGRHAIFDFLKRDVSNYRPSFAAFDATTQPFLWGGRTPWIVGLIVGGALALVAFFVLKLFGVAGGKAAIAALLFGGLGGAAADVGADRLLPKTRPAAINRQQGETFWETLGKAGKRVRVMRMPVTFPPEAFPHGELFSGLGVPDLSGRIGKPFYFTSELFFQPKGQGDFSIEIVELLDNKGAITTEIKGPPNNLFPSADGKRRYVTIPMTLDVAADHSRLGIEVSGQRSVARRGRMERLGAPDVSLQPADQAAGHRALPRAVGRARGAAVPLADPVRPRTPAADRRSDGAEGVHQDADLALRPVQDHGLDDRHLVDDRRHDRRAGVLRGRQADRRPGAQDARRPAPGRLGRLRPLLRVHRPRAARDVALLRSQASAATRRRAPRSGATRSSRPTRRWTRSSAR